eukprot:13644159-Alexandrium_andersonii.AAC.1
MDTGAGHFPCDAAATDWACLTPSAPLLVPGPFSQDPGAASITGARPGGRATGGGQVSFTQPPA